MVRIADTLDSGFCVDCMEHALQAYGTPKIFNTDHGCQFTSELFTGVLKAHGITEFVSNALLRWATSNGLDMALIEPGKPWQNGVAESF